MLIVLIIVAILIIGLLGIASTKPDNFHFERVVTIDAPVENIFPFIDNLHEWEKWSPFEKLDPSMKRTYSGPDHGVGAKYEWDGKGQAGAGSMEVTESSPWSRVFIKLEFTRPFQASHTADFTLKPNGNNTTVTWALDGPHPFMVKVMHTLFPMEKMLAKSFDEGLAKLKQVAEQ